MRTIVGFSTVNLVEFVPASPAWRALVTDSSWSSILAPDNKCEGIFCPFTCGLNNPESQVKGITKFSPASLTRVLTPAILWSFSSLDLSTI